MIEKKRKQMESIQIDDVQKELDKNSKNIWHELEEELRGTRSQRRPNDLRKFFEERQKKESNRDDDDSKDEDIDKKSPFKVCVALDIGDCHTRIGYTLPNESAQLHVVGEWKTAILLDKTGEFKAFGDVALETFVGISFYLFR